MHSHRHDHVWGTSCLSTKESLEKTMQKFQCYLAACDFFFLHQPSAHSLRERSPSIKKPQKYSPSDCNKGSKVHFLQKCVLFSKIYRNVSV